ncbi:hypothetical protein BDZ89DRAFT_1127930 [Hymenopellis radicata]|nr:hypothetical protein BDZ89DRAFT_1127930 [Hymenopellis radicata]
MDAVNHIWDDELKTLLIGIFSRFNSMAVHHRLDSDVERFYHALLTFVYDLRQFSARLLDVYHMTSGITERNDFQHLVGARFIDSSYWLSS